MEKEIKQQEVLSGDFLNRLLALDLSTTVMGYSIFDLNSEELIEINYYKFKSKILIDRGTELRNILNKIIKNNNIKIVGIEENLKSFRNAFTNANAMLNTSKFNFLCQFIVRDAKIPLVEINVNTARSKCFPGFHKYARAKKGVKQKDIVFDLAVAELGKNFFPKKVMKSGPRKGDEVYLEEAKDMADSWVIGQAYFKIK